MKMSTHCISYCTLAEILFGLDHDSVLWIVTASLTAFNDFFPVIFNPYTFSLFYE